MNLFIIGAGFTKAVFPDAPLNGDLIERLASVFPDSKSSILRERYNTKDVEIALTRLDVELSSLLNSQGGSDDELKKLRQHIDGELASYLTSFCASEDLIVNSPWMSCFIDKVFSSGDVIVSLNYDCALEGALDCRGRWTPNGGYGPYLDNPLVSEGDVEKSPVTVLKIHGSVNFIIAPYADKPAAKAVGYILDEPFFPHSAKNTHFGYGAGTGKTYLIAPSYIKVPTVEISYLMLEALKASTDAKNLIIIGSALRPEDAFLTLLITNFLHQHGWRDRKIIIIDPAAQAISERLNLYCGVNVSDQIVPIAGCLEDSLAHLQEAIKLRKTKCCAIELRKDRK